MIENTGLVLEGGGMRGLYTAGVLRYFMEQGLYFRRGIGVSAGVCHACSYFCHQKERALRVSVDYLDNKEYCSLASLVKTGDFFGVEMVYHIVPDEHPLDNEFYMASGAELYSVVTDCDTGQPVYFKITDMYRDIDYIRASASLPLMSRIVEIGGHGYLDGGISDSIPLRAMEDMGLARNVVILTQPRSYRKKPNHLAPLVKLRYPGRPGLWRAMQRRHEVYNRTLAYIRGEERRGRVFVFAPETDLGVGRLEKDRAKLEAVYERGFRDARAQFPALERFLEAAEKAERL